jgi:hypothetical protein
VSDSPFAGPRAKLQRAETHLQSLDDEWRAFIETQPYAVSHEFKPEPPNGQWTSRFVIERPIPLALSVIMGDALHNLRSCLDHLVGCFVERHGGAISSHHTFPILHSKKQFEGKVEKARRKGDRGGPLYGIPNPGPEWALIEESQPYHHGDASREHPLAVLNEMVNIDKHRQLHAAMAYPEADSAIDLLQWQPEDAVPIECISFWEPGQLLRDGTRIATLRFGPDCPAPKIAVKNPISLAVAFGDHDPDRARGNFHDVFAYVKAIIEQAEAL